MFGIIHSDIYYGSLIVKGGPMAVYVFTAFVSLAEADDCVRMTPEALGRIIGIGTPPFTWEDFYQAISLLESPDPQSNISDFDGRRIILLSELTEGKENRGWWIVNRQHYRETLSILRDREKARERVSRHRAKKRNEAVTPGNGPVTPGNGPVTPGNGCYDININMNSNIKESISYVPTVHTPPPTPEEIAVAPIIPPEVDSTPNCPYGDIQAMWNNLCTELPKISDLTDKRKDTMKRLWKKHHDLEWWSAAFKRINASMFLTGNQDKGGNWKATIDWFLKSDNSVKLMEGAYDDRRQSAGPVSRILTGKQRGKP